MAKMPKYEALSSLNYLTLRSLRNLCALCVETYSLLADALPAKALNLPMADSQNAFLYWLVYPPAQALNLPMADG